MPMSMNATNMTTNWGENIQGAEQATLSDFASELEAHVAMDGNVAKKDVDIREEAEILLSLLSAKPPSQAPSMDDDEYAYADYQELIRRDPSFSFTIPLMSLKTQAECSSKRQDSSTVSSSDESTTTQDDPVATLAPAVLLGRQLVGDGSSVEADKYGDIMARNMAESFKRAVEWRLQVWIRSLSSILVQRERALTEVHASDDIIQELLDTAEAQVLLCLQMTASEIKVVDTKTNFRVLSQRINCSQEYGASTTLKKRKLEDLDSLQTESEYRYSVAHVLSFESTMNLKTPAGYTEVTIEAPGIIEGSFLSSDSGEDTLTRISVEVDTNVIARAIERASRVVARTATHAVIPTPGEESDDDDEEEYVPKEELATPSPTLDAKTGSDPYDENKAVLVTPHKTTSSTMYEVNGAPPRFPDDLNNVANEVVRMVSPQPRTPEYLSFHFTPRTPQDKTAAGSGDELNLVSPPSAPAVSPPTPSSKTSSEDEASPSLSARKSPSLPALLQVASAAMKAC